MSEQAPVKWALVAGWVIWLLILVAGVGWYAGIRLAEVGHFGWLLVREMALLGFLLVGAFGYGALAITLLGFRDYRSGTYYLFAIALGLGIIARLVLALGMFRLLYATIAWALVAVGVAIALLQFYKHRETLSRITLPRTPWFSVILFVLLAINCLLPLLTDALVPPLWWDEVAYHLAVPKIYIQHHSVVYIPFIPYSNWPMEAEMLFTLGLLARSEALPHLVEWSSLVLTCWGLYLLGKRLFSPWLGLLAAVLFSTTPMVTALAGTALIELTLTLFAFLATFCFLEWTETQHDKCLVLSALFGGLAASTKLNGALIPLILGILTAAVIIKRSKAMKKAAVHFFLFGAVAFLVVAPWYIKNWIHTGNPFWPFLHEILGGRNWDTLGTEYLLGFIRKPNMAFTLPNWFLGLWYQTFQRRFGPPQIALGIHYLILLPIAVPALFSVQPTFRRWSRRLSVLALLYYTAWFFQTHQTRFLMPTTPVLAVLAALGIGWLVELREQKLADLIRVGLALFLVYTNWLADPTARAQVSTRWSFLSGRVTREDFLLSQVPGYATFVYANNHLPPDAYVWLALYESRGYYLDRNYMWANPISQRVLRLEQFTNAEDLADTLRALGFTHILFRPIGLERFTYIRYGEDIIQLTRALLALECRLVYATPELELYELVGHTSSE